MRLLVITQQLAFQVDDVELSVDDLSKQIEKFSALSEADKRAHVNYRPEKRIEDTLKTVSLKKDNK